MASKADLDRAVERLEHRIDQQVGGVDRRVDKLTARLNFVQSQIGIATLVKLFVHG